MAEPLVAGSQRRRYPGVRSFEDDDTHRRLFYGREKEVYALLQLVLAERLVLLLARSGIGKSSIISAGLLQPLRDEGFFPMVVRVSGDDDPLASLYKGVDAACTAGVKSGLIEACEPADRADWNLTTLWHFFKSFYVWREGNDQPLEPVIIIDQFEELFTIVPDSHRKRFINEIADLVRGTRPRLPSDSATGALELGERPPHVKVLLAIREDFMASLEEMAERIPSILRSRFRLGPLTYENARRAIVEPAGYVSDQIDTRPFAWSSELVEHVLEFLCGRVSTRGSSEKDGEVEPFQLQLICQHVEDLVREKRLTTVSLPDVGGDSGLDEILSRFYNTTIGQISRRFGGFMVRRRLKKLCEEGLITGTGRRLLREESTIQRTDRISPDVLAELVNSRLIRKEPKVGDNYYELSHDTLIAPILRSRQQRQRRNRTGALAAVSLVLVATLLTVAMIRRQAARTETALLRDAAAPLLQFGKRWDLMGNHSLAAAFYNQAAVTDPSLGGQVLNVQNEKDAKSFGRMQAETAVKRAGEVSERLTQWLKTREQKVSPLDDSREALEKVVATAELLAARGEVSDAADVYVAAITLAELVQQQEAATLAQQQRVPGDRLSESGSTGDSGDSARRERRRLPPTEAVLASMSRFSALLAQGSYISRALRLYAEVEKRFRQSLSVVQLNWLCWGGGLYLADPRPVEDACERAVSKVAPGVSGAVRDSRGLVKARLGKFRGAIEDFQAYVEWGRQPVSRPRRAPALIERRQQWIRQLTAGRNPFTDDELNELRREERNTREREEARNTLLRQSLQVEFMNESLTALLTKWSEAPVVSHELRNGEFRCDSKKEEDVKQCDRLWEEGKLRGFTQIETNPCSERLKELKERVDGLEEIFATEKNGGVACLSNKTSDYYQADEGWWLAARQETRSYSLEYDRSAARARAGSAASSMVAIYVPVYHQEPSSPEKQFIGVIKAVFDVESVGHPIEPTAYR